jgi:hypothetical protein
MKIPHVRIGDRVEHASTWLISNAGTVDMVDRKQVVVKWDDGTTGVLYYEGIFSSGRAQARKLIRLRQKEIAE